MRIENLKVQTVSLSDGEPIEDGIYIVRDGRVAHRFKHETANSNRKIIDCFLFRDELDILELRFEELYDVVDHFVIVESTRTWSGLEKPLIFDLNRHRFEKWADKIVYFQDSEIPELGDTDTLATRKVLETHQRDSIAKGLAMIDLADDDIVLLSDVDELPRPEYVKLLDNLLPPDKFITFVQQMYICYINNISRERRNMQPWAGTVAGRFRHFRQFTPTHVRFKDFQLDEHRAGLVLFHIRFEGELYIDDGGWHFSYFGGPEHEAYKLSTLIENAGVYDKIAYQDSPPSRHNYKVYRDNVPEYRTSLVKSYVELTPVTSDFEISDLDLPKALMAAPLKYERFFFLDGTID